MSQQALLERVVGALEEAVRRRQMFTLIQSASGDKVDFWPLSNEAYDRERFDRRQVVEALGMRLAVSAPEDTILMKLRWSRDSGGSEKQLTDALRPPPSSSPPLCANARFVSP